MIGHPREELLLAFQDHRLDDRNRRRLAGHLSGCQRCRNMVQSHRAVRGVFALEPPFAPDGVFERVLASRASGTLVMLPTEEHATRRRLEWPSRGFMVAMSAVLAVALGVQFVPMSRLQQVWGAWGAVIADWSPLGEGSILDLNYPLPPVAVAAVIVPERIRPVRAHYRISLLSGDQEPRYRELTLELSRQSDGWLLNSAWGARDGLGYDRYSVTASLNASLQPTGWYSRSSTGDTSEAALRESFYTVRGDSIQEIFRRHPVRKAYTRYDQPYDSTFVLSHRSAAPYAVTDAHFYALFMGIELRRGWVGSIYPRISPRYWSLFKARAESFVAVDGGMITTPAGTFATWEVRDLRPAPMQQGRIWVSKEHGLVVKTYDGDRYGSEAILESVTFP